MGDMTRMLATSALLVALLVGTTGAMPAGRPAALAALALCRAAEGFEGAARRASLERGLVLARAAVAADAGDAAAHFAAFCALGRLVQLRGLRVFRPFEALDALAELDTAVRLAPDDPDVLAAKGATLLRLPRVLGGDAREGREWLRRALARDPHHCAARAYLVAADAPDGVGDDTRLLAGC
jgi:cytochrome c-type biogenesis protein CcmH/NrfG